MTTDVLLPWIHAAADTADAAVETANDASTTANGIDAKATQAQTDAAAALASVNDALANSGNPYFAATQTSWGGNANPVTTGEGAVAAGVDSSASSSAVAVGTLAQATSPSSTAIGMGAAATVNSAVALGASSHATQPYTVAVGNAGLKRRIVHLAPGIDPTDAVTVQQMQQYVAQMLGVNPPPPSWGGMP